jgi:broad specificity phosphatase PhoE
VGTPRRPSRTPPTSTTRRRSASAVVAVLVLCLTGCSPDSEPLPTVSPAGPTTTLVTPTPFVTTIGRASPGITTVSQPTEKANWTFVVVRHANWRDDGSADPPLTEAGVLRARRLADLLYSYAGVATYATRFRRAKDTAHPTAELWQVPVTVYDKALRPADLINQIKQQHPTGAILIVGHSDTLPGIVGELCRCRIDPIPESDYANKYEVALRSDSTLIALQHDAGY